MSWKDDIGAPLNTRHIDVIDGIRALGVLIVMWFHVWQQSWLMPAVQLPFLSFLGIDQYNPDIVRRSGYLLVDLMMLISAFCLFLPHARNMLEGEKLPSWKQFYKKRAVRILPSYYLCVIGLFFLFALPTNAYNGNTSFMWRDLVSHLTFTQMYQVDTFVSTNLNVVLWTVAIEVQFYLIFPFIAKWFRKNPGLTYIGMVAVSLAYIHLYALRQPYLMMTVNRMPTFLCVFANGMMAAYAYVAIANKYTREKAVGYVSMGVSILCIAVFAAIAPAAIAGDKQAWQLENRYLLSGLFTVFILSTALSAKAYRVLYSNRLMRFLAAISYNLYIWHQWIAANFKQWRIPGWEGDALPNQTGDLAWQWKYTLIVYSVSIASAALITYGFEKPMAKLLLKDPKLRLPAAPPSEAEAGIGE